MTPDQSSLLCRVGALVCAIPVESVVEILRPLPVEPVPGTPACVAGAAVIRGVPEPVVSLARLLGVPEEEAARRFVLVRAGERRVALAVDEVVGIRRLPPAAGLPPLLKDASREAVDAIATLDGAFLLTLETSRMVPDALVAALAAGAAPP
jgi:purine-binding chemotaxis protein CheW